MFLMNESFRTDAHAGPPAGSRVATAPSEMSACTHFQPGITFVEAGGVVDVGHAERLSDYVADLVSPGLSLIYIFQSTKTPRAEWRLDTPVVRAMRPPGGVTQPCTPIAWRALRVEPTTKKGPLDAGVIS